METWALINLPKKRNQLCTTRVFMQMYLHIHCHASLIVINDNGAMQIPKALTGCYQAFKIEAVAPAILKVLYNMMYN